MSKNLFAIQCILAIALFSGAAVSAGAQTQHTICRKIPIPGNGSWDNLAVDENTNRLFISHGKMVQVLDIDKGVVIDSITQLNGVHAIAIVSSLNKGFITSGSDNSLVVFDLTSLKVIKTISLSSQEPDGMWFDAATKRLFVMNARSSNASVFDAQSFELIKDITLSGRPDGVTGDGKASVYVNIDDKGDVCKINARSLVVEKTFSLAPGENPAGLAIDVFNSRLFAVCRNRMLIVMDLHNGKVVSKVTIGEVPEGVVFDPVLSQLFCSNTEGTMSIVDAIDAQTYKLCQTMATMRGARTCALNSKTHKVYIATAQLVNVDATPQNPRPKPVPTPDSFVVLEVCPRK